MLFRNYSNLMLNMEHLYMNEPIRDPPSFSFIFLPKNVWLWWQVSKSCFNVVYISKYSWLMLFLERNFFRILNFYIIYLRKVVIVILQAHVRRHSLCSVLQNHLITKKWRHKHPLFLNLSLYFDNFSGWRNKVPVS